MKLEKRLNKDKIFIEVIFDEGNDLSIKLDKNGKSAEFECKDNKRIVEINTVIGKISNVSKIYRGRFIANSDSDISDKILEEIVSNFYEIEFITGSIPVTYMFPKRV